MSEQYKQLDPDIPIVVNWISIYADYEIWPVAYAVNTTLKEAGRKERMRVFMFDGLPIASGIWTQEKAAEIAETGHFVNELYAAPNGELSHQQGPGWQEISYKVDKGVVDVLVDKGLLIPKEDERGKYRLELTEGPYRESPYFMEVSINDSAKEDVVNFQLLLVDRIPPSGPTIH